MGSFPGHLLPGAFFVCFAFWWTTQLFKRNQLCKVKGITFYSTTTYPCGFGKCMHWPVESMIKIIVTVIGIAGETFAAFDYGRSSTIVSIGDIQHVTMYSFFCLSGVADILQAKCSWVPPGLDYIALAAAFSAEGILFHFHLHGRDELDTQIHILLVGTIFACVISIIIEYNKPNSLIVCALRIYLVFLQGTWFIQVGFILYNPFPGYGQWDPGNHGHLQLTAIIFIWHAIGVLLLMITIITIVALIRSRYCPVSRYSDEYHVIGHHSYRIMTFLEDDPEESDEESLCQFHQDEDNATDSGRTQVTDTNNGRAECSPGINDLSV